MADKTRNPERDVPAVGRLLDRREIAFWFPRLSRPYAKALLHDELAKLRLGLRAGEAALPEEVVVERLAEALRLAAGRRLRPVLNGSGVLLHTNLGRSPLGKAEWAAAGAVNTGYSNLELDLEKGERGRRGGLSSELAALLAGAEAALVVNNNAAALLLALKAIAAGREVVVARGEQVQIGGGFRIPEILALSGARFVEVGTTNVTTSSDYLDAIGPDTACVLRVHTSNFTMRGFVSKPSTSELAARLPPGLPLIVDQGSGAIAEGIPGEESVADCVRAGASLVCFSGDKLLGGPQSGIAAGKADLVARLARDPLFRALRPGKTILSLLEERLVGVLNGTAPLPCGPDLGELREFAAKIMAEIEGDMVALVPSFSTSGGGTSPDEVFPSLALALDNPRGLSSQGLLDRLRAGEPPLIAIIRGGQVLVDLAALRFEEPSLVASCLARALSRGG